VNHDDTETQRDEQPNQIPRHALQDFASVDVSADSKQVHPYAARRMDIGAALALGHAYRAIAVMPVSGSRVANRTRDQILK